MKTTMLTICILALASTANAAQYLTVNGQPLDSIAQEVGQTCTVEVHSEDANPYTTIGFGFLYSSPIGQLTLSEITPEAGSLASVDDYDPIYALTAGGSGIAPGVHFVFEFAAPQQLGQSTLELTDDIGALQDSIEVTVFEAEPTGTAFTYQGYLYDTNSPADGLYDIEFELYSDPNATTPYDTVTKDDVDVVGGYFTVGLDFGSDVFTGDARWLEIGVRPGDSSDVYTTLSPRQEVTPAPYSLYAQSSGSDNDWMVSGNDMYSIPSGNVGIGTTSPQNKLDAEGAVAVGATYSGTDTAPTNGMIVEGNVGIGTPSPAANAQLTVNGAILRDGSTMYGANANTHINLGTSSTTGTNGQNYSYATVGGGKNNTASGHSAAVGGGYGNNASGDSATVGGGIFNTSSGIDATVGGGYTNNASSNYATVAGGRQNIASNVYATVGGGFTNTASSYATVAGGSGNIASGGYATVPGGRANTAGGNYSFAAGRRGKVRDAAASGDGDGDEGTFIWADSTNADFQSTGPDQFLIRASGGVGIGTDSPSEKLDVNGKVSASAYTSNSPVIFEAPSGTERMRITDTGNVGIGTTSPQAQLQVGDTSTGHSVYVAGPTTGQSAVWFYDGSLAGGMQYTFTTDDLLFYTAGTAGLTIDSTGNVGIGTLDPAEKLEVAGNVKVTGDLIYSSPQTRYFAIPSCAFMPQSKSIDWYSVNGFVRGDTPGQAVTFLAPIHLPHGATLTQFIAVIKDSDATQDISLRLLRQFATGGGGFISDTLASSGTPGPVRINSPLLSEVIDNLNYAYLIQAWWTTPSTDTDIELFHVQICYTVTTSMP